MSEWLLMPLLAAAVGGVTNWIAVQVTLYPVRPLRFGPLRIQGLVPRKAERMARGFVERMLPDVLSLRSLMHLVDSRRVADDAVARLGPQLDAMIEASLAAVNPEHWRSLRPQVQAYWIERLRPGIPDIMVSILGQVQDAPERYLDARELAAQQVRERPGLLSEVLWQTGHAEFRFIEWSGAVLGGLMGLALAALWNLSPNWVTAAIGGGMVGGLTNWLALKMVFAPMTPVKLGPWVVQGLIFRRQQEVSAMLAANMLETLVSFGAMFGHLSQHSDRFRDLCRNAIEAELEQTSGGASTLVMLALGAHNNEQAVDAMAAAMVQAAPPVFGNLQLEAADRAAIADVLRQRLQQLSPRHYGEMMHFMVAEDEPLLVIAGLVVGAVAAAASVLLL
jgi:uncharacterized membrane protein YheB (UPF0754 family)